MLFAVVSLSACKKEKIQQKQNIQTSVTFVSSSETIVIDPWSGKNLAVLDIIFEIDDPDDSVYISSHNFDFEAIRLQTCAKESSFEDKFVHITGCFKGQKIFPPYKINSGEKMRLSCQAILSLPGEEKGSVQLILKSLEIYLNGIPIKISLDEKVFQTKPLEI